MFKLLLFAFLNCILLTNGATNWAVLVAGSNEYYNFRHQADICHAYQIFHENNIPDENIIVMMYDDIANNTNNPFPGTIINKPLGANVYKGVPKDYVGDDVNPDNFLAVLKGDSSSASGRVLNTTKDDNIFIYFSDHGAVGLVAFPNSYLYAHQLMDALEYMYNNGKYNHLVFYLEACEAGSMFNNLLNSSMNIYATTAATPTESSYACYLDPLFQTYLGDLYSVNWLENSDSFENIWNETLRAQFMMDKVETNMSEVCQYGNMNMSRMGLKNFMLFNNASSHLGQNKLRQINSKGIAPKDVINSEDVEIDFLMREYVENADYDRKRTILRNLQQEFTMRTFYDAIFKEDYDDLKSTNATGCYPNYYIDTYCLQDKIELFESHFGKFTSYGMKYVRLLAEDCKVSRNY